jgi:hypothetical protein
MSLNLIHDTEQIKKLEEMFYTVEKPVWLKYYFKNEKKNIKLSKDKHV